jgi:hypothetical protein
MELATGIAQFLSLAMNIVMKLGVLQKAERLSAFKEGIYFMDLVTFEERRLLKGTKRAFIRTKPSYWNVVRIGYIAAGPFDSS